jgi:CubicO group peptidase (beta-lactamase class C family)
MSSRTTTRSGRMGLVAVTVGMTLAFAGTVAPAGTAAPVSAPGSSYAETITDAQAALTQTLDATGATSISAILTDAQGSLWQGSAGVADAAGAIPEPSTTLYGIGSTSKLFATMAVMQLVEAGRIGLDQPVARYLPQFTMRSPQYRQITVRMLLDHSAGLPGATYDSIFTTRPWPGYGQQVLNTLAASPLKTTPGAMAVYCNDCFTLAGELVAKVSGMPFTTYVERRILAPLGMTASTYATTGAPASAAQVVSAGRNDPFVFTNAYASGGLMSTTTEMAAFARALLNGGSAGSTRVLLPQSIIEMGRSQLATTLLPITRNPFDFGLGWDTVTNLSLAAVGVRTWMKGGDAFAYHSALLVAPDAGLAVFVTGAGMTVNSGSLEAVAQRILLHALAERGDISAVPSPIQTQQPGQATPTENDINAMTGTYLAAMGAVLRLRRGPDAALLMDQFAAGSWAPNPKTLTFRTDGTWRPADGAASSLRTVAGWGRTYLVHTSPDGYGNALGEMMIGQRVESTGATSAAWTRREGAWLLVSDRPDSANWTSGPELQIWPIPGLPGYLYLSGQYPFDARRPNIGSMFLQIPIAYGRDLNDVSVVEPDVLRFGTQAVRNSTTVPALSPGANAVAIHPTGYAEWRLVPARGRISITGAHAWKLYSPGLELLASGGTSASDMRAPANTLLLVFGAAGDDVTVQWTPAT